MKTHFLRRLLVLAAPWPALLLGVWTMRCTGLPSAVWGQNLAAGLVLFGGCALLPAGRMPRLGVRGPIILTLSALGLLAGTFLEAGSEGVHRWVQVGPLRIHAAAIVLPPLLIALGAWQRQDTSRPRSWLVVVAGGIALALLVWQPDAAQATAFAGAALVLLVLGRAPLAAKILAFLGATAAIGWVWQCHDPLLPIPHVEGIVDLAAQGGLLWRLGALASLVVLPLPFLFAHRNDPTPLALGIYFALCLLGSFVGAFPVPVMGFGLSPIIGYAIALGWLRAGEVRTAPTED